MRKFMALLMSCTLLLISSMPSLALASMCDISDDSSITLASKAASQHRVIQKHHAMHPHIIHSREVSKDWQTCRIECGCGCHRNVDSLPHLLSPHIISQVTDLPRLPTPAVAEAVVGFDCFYIAPVQLPPPDLG